MNCLLYISIILYISAFIYWVVAAIKSNKKIKEWRAIDVENASIFEKASKSRNLEYHIARRAKAIEEFSMMIVYFIVFIYAIKSMCSGWFTH